METKIAWKIAIKQVCVCVCESERQSAQIRTTLSSFGSFQLACSSSTAPKRSRAVSMNSIR